MNQPADPADSLFARARSGDQDAWRELFEACYPKVLRVVRRKLTSPTIRSLYDSTDFIGDVWKSLAEKPESFDFPTLGALVGFLSLAAERKVIDEYRRHQTLKNDRQRERPFGAWPQIGGGEPASADPTPSQHVVALEVRERLFRGQSDDERRILELKDLGYSNDEIAQRVSWHVRRVQRFLKELGDSWTEGDRP